MSPTPLPPPQARSPRRSHALLAPAALLSAALLGSAWLVSDRPAPDALQPRQAFAQDAIQQSQMLADITARAMQSVVAITATRPRTQPAVPWFGGTTPNSPAPQGMGSGVIVTGSGRVLTNHHVIDGAESIRVRLADGRQFEADVVGSDEPTDIAVLQLRDARNLQPLPYGDSAQLRAGELVLAIGSPFGLAGSASLGIVSATGRANMGILDYEEFIQTDAAINPGNSGGALVDMYGRLVGINTAIVSRSGGNQGIGFAIPANMVRGIAETLSEHGQVTRGWLGVGIRDVDHKVRTQLARHDLSGAVIRSVEAGTPAATAGLQAGDIVLSYDGIALADGTALRNRVAASAVGSVAELRVLRGDQEVLVPVTLGERPRSSQARPR